MTGAGLGFLAAVAFVATTVAANWALERFGLVPVAPGLLAPAGVYFAGLAFTLRDLVHEALGRAAVSAAILAGAVVSWHVAPEFALASAGAFLVSEFADFAVYAPLRRRGWLGAVLASNLVGLLVDSLVFLWLAFGSFTYLAGQVVGKLWVTLATVGALWLWRRSGSARINRTGSSAPASRSASRGAN